MLTLLPLPPVLPPNIISTARRYASAVYAVVVCPSVCLSVRPSQARIVLYPLNTGSRKQRRTIAQGRKVSDAKDLTENPPASPPTGGLKSANFDK